MANYLPKNLEEGCRKARFGVGGRVPESEVWSGRKVPESEEWDVRKGSEKRGLEW